MNYNGFEIFRLFATVALLYGVYIETGVWTTVFATLLAVRLETQAFIKKIRAAQEIDALDKAIGSLKSVNAQMNEINIKARSATGR